MGGTGGIGLATARRFLEEGARVVVSGVSPLEPATSQHLASLGRIEFCGTDVASEGEVDALFQFALQVFEGRLDILVHVAGISGRRFGDGPLHDCTVEGWDRVFDINARGAFLTNRQAVRVMRRQAPDHSGLRGSVVNVGSVLDSDPSPRFFGTIAYAASKGALRSLTTAAASAYAAEHIRFNLVRPGLVATPMAARALGNQAIQSFLAAKQPLSGGPVTAADVAEAILSLSEPASRHSTGVELAVDGGWRLAEGLSAETEEPFSP